MFSFSPMQVPYVHYVKMRKKKKGSMHLCACVNLSRKAKEKALRSQRRWGSCCCLLHERASARAWKMAELR